MEQSMQWCPVEAVGVGAFQRCSCMHTVCLCILCMSRVCSSHHRSALAVKLACMHDWGRDMLSVQCTVHVACVSS